MEDHGVDAPTGKPIKEIIGNGTHNNQENDNEMINHENENENETRNNENTDNMVLLFSQENIETCHVHISMNIHEQQCVYTENDDNENIEYGIYENIQESSTFLNELTPCANECQYTYRHAVLASQEKYQLTHDIFNGLGHMSKEVTSKDMK